MLRHFVPRKDRTKNVITIPDEVGERQSPDEKLVKGALTLDREDGGIRVPRQNIGDTKVVSGISS